LVAQLSRAPTVALGLTKKAIYSTRERNLAEQLHVEREYQKEAGRTFDFEEGVAAFLAKRPAAFQGR
jgi:2-(1,2-epoxy-1,2-dihydrophenyl)acetyl-CoA isomerase